MGVFRLMAQPLSRGLPGVALAKPGLLSTFYSLSVRMEIARMLSGLINGLDSRDR